MFEVLDTVPDADGEALSKALIAHNVDMIGASHRKPLYIPLKNAQGAVEGGLIGATARGWLHVDILFVPQQLRGQGLAAQLLQAAEDEARKRGCKGALIDTANPVARRIYGRQGYDICGTLEDYGDGHSITWMKKML
jgi:GNAT superfamily N-acetyltransferase